MDNKRRQGRLDRVRTEKMARIKKAENSIVVKA